MHNAHCSTRVIQPDMIRNFTKLNNTEKGKVNSDHNPVKSTFNIKVRKSTAKPIQGVQRIPNTETGYLIRRGYKEADEPEKCKIKFQSILENGYRNQCVQDSDTTQTTINKWMKSISMAIHNAWEQAGHMPKGKNKDSAPGPCRTLSPGEVRIKAHIQSNGGTIAEASESIRKENAISKTLWERYSCGAKPSISPSKHCRISKVVVTHLIAVGLNPFVCNQLWVICYNYFGYSTML